MMYTKITLVLILILCLGDKPKAQSTQHKKVSQVVSVNLLPILFTSFNVAYERAMFDKWSIAASFNYFENKPIFNSKNATWTGITVDAQRYTNQACQGFYMAPYIKYRNVSYLNNVYYKIDPNNSSNSIYLGQADEYHNQIGGGAKLGYQKISKWGIGFNLFAGAGYYPIHFKTGALEDRFEDVSEFDLRLGLSLAYGF
ncbi:MAG: DUF3575 domain-containing protein [Bacteroidota bacterium]